MITSKLPNDVQLRVAREMREDVWRNDDLLEIIKREVEARETCKGTLKPKPNVRPPAINPTEGED